MADAEQNKTGSVPADATDPGQGDGPPPGGNLLARELTGDLPCVRCGYNLRGLSVRSVCPECGAAVRATILAIVDPHAGELQPLSTPMLTWVGLLLWSIAAAGAAALTWGLRLVDTIDLAGTSGPNGLVQWAERWSPTGIVILAGLSGLGAIALVRPHGRIPGWKIAMACVGVLAYVPLAWLCWRLHGVYDPAHLNPFFQTQAIDPTRVFLRLGIGALIAMAIIGLRPNARLLVARSMLLRSGRVDRQTLIAMIGAVGVAALGDTLHLLTGIQHGLIQDITRLGGTFLIAVGSMLLTLGLAGVVVDCWRLARVIREPVPTLGQLLKPRDQSPASAGGPS